MNDNEGEAIGMEDIELQDDQIDSEIEALEKSVEINEELDDVEPVEIAEGNAGATQNISLD